MIHPFRANARSSGRTARPPLVSDHPSRLVGRLAPLSVAAAVALGLPGQAFAAHPIGVDGATATAIATSTRGGQPGDSTASAANLASAQAIASELSGRVATDMAAKAGTCTDVPVPQLPATIARPDGTTYALANASHLRPGWTCTGPFSGTPRFAIIANSIRIGIPSPGYTGGSDGCPASADGLLPCYTNQTAAPITGPCGPPESPTTLNIGCHTIPGGGLIGLPKVSLPDLGTSEHHGAFSELPISVPNEVDAIYYNEAGQRIGSTSRTSYLTATRDVNQPGSAAAPSTADSSNTPSGKSYQCVYDTSSTRVYSRDGWTVWQHGDPNDDSGGSNFLHDYSIEVYEADHARQSGHYNGKWTWQVEICGSGTAANTSGDVFQTALSISMDSTDSGLHIGMDAPSGSTQSNTPSSLAFSLDVGPVGVSTSISNAAGATLTGAWGKNCVYPVSSFGPNNWPVNEASDCWDATHSSQHYSGAAAEANALYEFSETCNCEANYDAMAASEYDGGRGISYYVH